MVNEVAGLERIRFTSPHPSDFSDEQIRAFAELDKLCPHMHLPVQSGSSRVLRAMKRGYTREEYLDIVARFRAEVPHASLTTDVIVGFPSETEAEFEETLSLFELVRFQGAFSFAFSERTGTKALEIEPAVPMEERFRRLQVLQALQDRITTEQLVSTVGKVESVLIEGPSKSNPERSSGRSGTHHLVHIDGEFAPGTVLPVLITEAFKHSLFGRPTDGTVS
jgi:tRNA-2-methylthio-N6-dimethylallyladenosine synthase